MGECPMIASCQFASDRMKGMPSNSGRIKEQYCLDDFKSCARYMVGKKLGESRIPANLFPNQNERARSLVGSAAHP